MYFCRECKNTFDYPSVQVDEYLEAWGRMVPRTADFCPCCGSQDFKELCRRCDVCGELITGKYISVNDGTNICEYCYCECDEVDDV